MCVQYIGGCSVHRGVFSTSGGYHEYIGGYHDECGGYHEYIGGCSVHRRDIMIHVGEQLQSNVLNIPRCTEHTLYRVRKLSQCQYFKNEFLLKLKRI